MGTAKPNLQQTIYAELRQLAAARLAKERQDHTLQATALVHEVYLRLQTGRPEDFSSRAEFFAAAAESMRRVLVDHARRRARLKRGGGQKRIALSTLDLAVEQDPNSVLEFDEALQGLAEADARAEQIVRLRFFAGLPSAEIAQLLGISERTVRNDWDFARAWLFEALGDSPDRS